MWEQTWFLFPVLCAAMNRQIDQVRIDLPSYEDLKGTASALMRLQDTYQLDASLVAQGDLGGVKSPALSGKININLGTIINTLFYGTYKV